MLGICHRRREFASSFLGASIEYGLAVALAPLTTVPIKSGPPRDFTALSPCHNSLARLRPKRGLHPREALRGVKYAPSRQFHQSSQYVGLRHKRKCDGRRRQHILLGCRRQFHQDQQQHQRERMCCCACIGRISVCRTRGDRRSIWTRR